MDPKCPLATTNDGKRIKVRLLSGDHAVLNDQFFELNGWWLLDELAQTNVFTGDDGRWETLWDATINSAQANRAGCVEPPEPGGPGD